MNEFEEIRAMIDEVKAKVDNNLECPMCKKGILRYDGIFNKGRIVLSCTCGYHWGARFNKKELEALMVRLEVMATHQHRFVKVLDAEICSECGMWMQTP